MNKNKVTKLNTLEQNFQSNLNKLLRNDQEINVDIHNTVLNIIKKMQNACGARELKILIQIFYMKLFQPKSLFQR